MLYWLLYDVLRVNFFRYPSTRILLAAATALILSIVVGPAFIRRLRVLKFGQQVRDDGPKTHEGKKGTPTMGGTLIVFSAMLVTALWADLRSPYLWFVSIVFVGYAFVGFMDDWLKITKKNTKGLPGRQKIVGQLLFGGAGLAVLFFLSPYDTRLSVPFVKPALFSPDIGLLYVPFALLVLVGTSNAVNLTDGLDGLAIVPVVISAGVFLVLCYAAGGVVGGFDLAAYLRIPELRGAEELAVFCAAIAGAGLGFLWYNAHPAEVFMGDVGALGLGGALGALAIVTKNEFVSAIIHAVFVAEALSVMIQVASYKFRNGKRVFKMAPLHHHFELLGWPEPKVIVRFWIVAALMAFLGLASLKLR